VAFVHRVLKQLCPSFLFGASGGQPSLVTGEFGYSRVRFCSLLHSPKFLLFRVLLQRFFFVQTVIYKYYVTYSCSISFPNLLFFVRFVCYMFARFATFCYVLLHVGYVLPLFSTLLLRFAGFLLNCVTRCYAFLCFCYVLLRICYPLLCFATLLLRFATFLLRFATFLLRFATLCYAFATFCYAFATLCHVLLRFCYAFLARDRPRKMELADAAAHKAGCEPWPPHSDRALHHERSKTKRYKKIKTDENIKFRGRFS